MINDLKELKKFLTWARENKVKCVKIEGVEFELSDYAFVEDLNQSLETPKAQEKLLEEANNITEDDETLFWST